MPTNKEEIKEKASKTERIKAWAPIITAVIALAGTVIVAWMSAPSSKVNSMIERLDQKLIPKLEETIDELKVKVAKLEVYREVFEKEIDKLKSTAKTVGPPESIAAKVSAANAKVPKEAKFELPRVQMEQRVLDVASEK
jgi:hypothetical protein